MKKIMLLLLVIALVPLGSFAAATKETPTKTSQPVVIRVHGSPETIPANDPILPELKKRINVDLTVEKGTDATLSALVASGNIPDLLLVGGLNYLTSFYKNGVLLNLSPYVDKMPHVKASINNIGWSKVTFDNKIYAVPGRPTGNYYGWYIRYDWLKKLNVDQPTTFDALLDVAVKMKNADLDGNGKNDTFPVSGVQISDAFSGFYTAYGVTQPNSLMIVDNKVVYACTSPQFKMAIQEIRRFVDAGVVDPEIVSNTWDTMREKMGTGKVGIVYGGWNQFGRATHQKILTAVDPNANWFYMRTPIKTKYGEAGAGKSVSGSGGNGKMNCLSADLANKPDKVAALIKMLEYVTYGEGDLLTSYGIEGTHYKVVNGKIVKLDAMNDLYHGYALQFTGRDDLTYCLTKFAECEDAVRFCNDNVKVYWFYQGLVQQPEGINLSDLYSYELQQLTQFIYGSRSMNEYDAFINTLNTSYNLNGYLASATQQLKTMGIIK
jgi:putative aldouronate transport system substrate-binding protein